MMIALGIVLIVLLALAFLRVAATAEYGGDGAVLYAFVGPVRIRLYPSGNGQEKKIEKKPKETDGGKKKPAKVFDLKEQLPSIKTALSRLKRKLTINEMTVYYMAAGSDPAETALLFGGASAGLGFLTPLLENSFRIKKRDFRTSVSFTETEPYIYIKAKLSLAVWEVFYIAFGLAVHILKGSSSKQKNGKAVEKHG